MMKCQPSSLELAAFCDDGALGVWSWAVRSAGCVGFLCQGRQAEQQAQQHCYEDRKKAFVVRIHCFSLSR